MPSCRQPALPRSIKLRPFGKGGCPGEERTQEKDGKDGQGLRQSSCSCLTRVSLLNTWAEIFPTTNIWLLFPSPHPNRRLPACSQTDWRLCKHARHRSLSPSPGRHCAQIQDHRAQTRGHPQTQRAPVWVHHEQQSRPQGPCSGEHSHACAHRHACLHQRTHTPHSPSPPSQLSDEGPACTWNEEVLHYWGLVSLDYIKLESCFPNLPQGWPYGKAGKLRAVSSNQAPGVGGR